LSWFGRDAEIASALFDLADGNAARLPKPIHRGLALMMHAGDTRPFDT